MGSQPKTGEKRRTHQPFAIDRLPIEWREQIKKWRADWKTWEQIEQLTATFEWVKLPKHVSAFFPGFRIPKSNLHRWYDVQVEQVAREISSEAEASRQVAAAFAGKGFADLDASVQNAIADQVFTLAKTAGGKDRQKFLAELGSFGWLLARHKQLDIQREKVNVEREKLEAILAKVKGLKGEIGKKKMTAEELQQRLDGIYGIGEK